eukprot:11020154-Lingulodinium_polyedra.AAC.1
MPRITKTRCAMAAQTRAAAIIIDQSHRAIAQNHACNRLRFMVALSHANGGPGPTLNVAAHARACL